MRLPAFPQHLTAGPAVVGTELDAEQRSLLAIKIGKASLGPREHPDRDVALGCEPLGKDAQRHGLTRSGGARRQPKAALADELLNSTAEGAGTGGDMEGLDGNVGGEGVPLEPVEREGLLG